MGLTRPKPQRPPSYLTAGRECKLLLPVCNRIDVPTERIARTLVIKTVRDMFYDPLTADDVIASPFTRWGHWEIDALDCDSQTMIRFAWSDRKRVVKHRLGIKDVDDTDLKEIEYFGPEFLPTFDDRKLMADSIVEFFQVADMSDNLQVVAVPCGRGQSHD